MKIGILIIGSLWWKAGLRETWRRSRLKRSEAIKVRVPIRYGRKSQKDTYTMTFGPSGTEGIAIVVPCIAEGEIDELRIEAEKLWAAEANVEMADGSIASIWGTVGAIFRDGTATTAMEQWSEYFRSKGGQARASVDDKGMLAIPWPERVDRQVLDCDVLLATANVEKEVTTPEGIAEAWISNSSGQEEYFFENMRAGIRTAQDAPIWRRMTGEPGWVEKINARFASVVEGLRNEYGPRIELPAPKMTCMDLFTPAVPVERFHSNFKAALSPLSLGEREVLEDWARGFVDRDHKFVKEFQTSFNACFWELYLHAVLKEFGFSLDWEHAAPDFLASRGGVIISVEATTANAAQGKPNEWDRELSPEALAKYPVPAINREASIRLSNAITAKHRKYRDDYRKLNHVSGRPFVIAVAPFEQPFFNLQHDRPIRCLLYDDYVDEEPYLKDPNKFPDGPPSISLGTLIKDNGSEIELGFFNSDAMEEVSAVIFSCVATWGKANALSRTRVKKSVFQALRTRTKNGPERIVGDQENYRETLEDGLQVYHNPHAKVPLDPAVFRREGVVQFYLDPVKGWIREGFEGALAWRFVWSFGSSEHSDSEPPRADPNPAAEVGP